MNTFVNQTEASSIHTEAQTIHTAIQNQDLDAVLEHLRLYSDPESSGLIELPSQEKSNSDRSNLLIHLQLATAHAINEGILEENATEVTAYKKQRFFESKILQNLGKISGRISQRQGI